MTDGRWLLQGTLKGPKGDKGDKGDQGDQGSSSAKDHTWEGRVVAQWTGNTPPGQESKQEGAWYYSVPAVGLGSWYLIEMGARMTGACAMTVSLTNRNGEVRARHRLTTDDQPLPVSYTTSRMVYLDKGYYTITLTTEGLGGKNPLTVDLMGAGWTDIHARPSHSFGRYFFMYAL